MSENFRADNLVLYKNQAARVTNVGAKKINIVTQDGTAVSVRPKDIELLHPGPLANFGQLAKPQGELLTAWELLAGETTNLEELSELAYDEFTPATAWAIWQAVDDGLRFSGTLTEITVHTPEQVAAEEETRAAKAAEAEAWNAFVERVNAGTFLEEDGRFLQEIAAVAMGQQERSQVLRNLNQSETPENAHALLLSLGYWDETVNPYPSRLGVNTSQPDYAIPALPEEERRDLTHLVALAIDDEGSRDPDDALSWEEACTEQSRSGRLWVHIADVAALIPPDSPADLEARARGANLYLPEGTIHMLPEAATAALALGLDDTSPALSFGLDVMADGTLINLEIVPSTVRVTRLSYDEAQTRLDESPFSELLAIAQAFEARREANGAVQINLPEVKIRLAQDGEVEIRPLPPLQSRDLVREAMLMTGEAVAQFAQQHNIPIPYTTQDAPTEIVEGDTPSANFARRKTMTGSQPGSTPGRHAGLGLDQYVQTTSPLRRYLDLVVHQQLRAYLNGEPLLDEQAVMERVGAAYAVSGDIRYAERLSNGHWTAVYLLRNPEWTGEGIVIDQRGKRDLILLPELGTETSIYAKTPNPLDSIVQVKLQNVDLPQREPNFRFL
ncbi:MAG: RNB domain-containing ribonuclease [Ardenticatenaceae bacterium]|nr:RNB domain-containing ribonuclease [Ardenticatenaceae bacterium]MCB8946486.1 RNB domain-containing ribonuclease [Ardenticatenaceae bacterium]